MRAITPLLSQVLTVLGETRLVMQYGLLCAVALPAGFYVLGTRWGTVGLAIVWVVIFPVLVLPAYQRVLRAIGLSPRDYLRALWPAASASLLMGLVVLTIRWAAGADLSRPLSVGLQIAAGALVYGLTCVALHGRRLAAFCRSLRPTGVPQPAREGIAS
jgi:O-antigen/teichoic acid export membrane protein